MSKPNYKIVGLSRYARVFGEPHRNYNDDGNEWSIDVELEGEELDKFKRLGLGEKKVKEKNGVTYVSFLRPEVSKYKSKAAGKEVKNKHIPVTDAQGNPWPDQTSIGNGSKIEVTFGVTVIPPHGKFKGGQKATIFGIKVLEHVPYTRPEAPAEGQTKPDANSKEDYSS